MSDATPRPKTAKKPDPWAAKPEKIELPSGKNLTATRAKVYVWSKTGQIPDDMLAILNRATTQGEEVPLADKMALVEWEICKCSVDPVLKLVPTEGFHCVDELDDMDKTYLIMTLGLFSLLG